jgi:hypothetical protein
MLTERCWQSGKNFAILENSVNLVNAYTKETLREFTKVDAIDEKKDSTAFQMRNRS